MKKDFNFTVLCMSPQDLSNVLDYDDDIFIHNDDYYEFKYTYLQNALNDLDVNEYGYEFQGGHSDDYLKNQYDNGDVDAYENALFQDGHKIYITFSVKNGAVKDWVWGDIKEYKPTDKNFDENVEKMGVLISYFDFENLIEKIKNDKITRETFHELVVQSIQTLKYDFNNPSTIIDKKWNETFTHFENILSSQDFVQDIGKFVIINGADYHFIIKKNEILSLELIEGEVFIQTSKGTKVLNFEVGEKYNSDLAQLCYARLMNGINWDNI